VGERQKPRASWDGEEVAAVVSVVTRTGGHEAVFVFAYVRARGGGERRGRSVERRDRSVRSSCSRQRVNGSTRHIKIPDHWPLAKRTTDTTDYLLNGGDESGFVRSQGVTPQGPASFGDADGYPYWVLGTNSGMCRRKQRLDAASPRGSWMVGVRIEWTNGGYGARG